MRNLHKQSGQALVETALLLPIFFFILVALLQFIFFVIMQMQLQHTASRLAALDMTRSNAAVKAIEFSRLTSKGPAWGFPSPFQIRHVPFQPWRPYPGISTLQPSGRLTTVELTYRFYPHFLYRAVQFTQGYAELPLESHVPGEGE